MTAGRGEQTKTLEIKKQIINKLVTGSTTREVGKYLQDTYGYKKRSADKLVFATTKELREHYKEYASNMAAYNLNRLTEIINECQEEGKYNEALKGIDILNKMASLYTQKVELKTDEPIEINFN